MAAEKRIETKVKKYLKDKGYYCEKIHGNEFQSGVSDLIACIEGRYCGFEVKAPDGSLSSLQKKKLRAVRRAGGIGEGVWSIEIVEAIVTSIRAGLKWHPVTDLTGGEDIL